MRKTNILIEFKYKNYVTPCVLAMIDDESRLSAQGCYVHQDVGIAVTNNWTTMINVDSIPPAAQAMVISQIYPPHRLISSAM